MTQEMGHDRCSELLRDYARAQLPAPEREAVEGHVATCSECLTELTALRVLLNEERPDLNGRERRKLHAAVARELAAGTDRAEGGNLPPRRSLAQRFAPTLAAAGLLVVAVGVALLGGDGGDESGGADTAVTQSRERNLDEASGGAGEGPTSGGGSEAAAPDTKPDKAGSKPKTDTNDPESADELEGRSAPGPRFKNVVVTGLDQMRDGVWDVAAAYTLADAERRVDGFLQRLSADAPAGVRDQVVTCGETAVEQADGPLLPATGAVGRIENQPSLLLGFAYATNESGPLDSYQVWAWPRGSCSSRLGYTSGPIEN